MHTQIEDSEEMLLRFNMARVWILVASIGVLVERGASLSSVQRQQQQLCRRSSVSLHAKRKTFVQEVEAMGGRVT